MHAKRWYCAICRGAVADTALPVLSEDRATVLLENVCGTCFGAIWTPELTPTPVVSRDVFNGARWLARAVRLAMES